MYGKECERKRRRESKRKKGREKIIINKIYSVNSEYANQLILLFILEEKTTK
jgi:hypothetical protein